MHALTKDALNDKSLLTIDDVAEAAGVSRSTVSLVLRNSPLVAARTNEKVREAIARLGYVYNRKAAIRARLSYLIGVIIPDLSNPFFSDLAAGIDSVLNDEGWVSLVGNCWESAAKQDLIIQRMQEHKVDGLLICPAVDSGKGFAERLEQTGFPVLQVLRRLGSNSDNYLGVDYSQGVSLAVDHLWSLGHTDIAFLGAAPHHSAATERRQGFEAAMKRHGLEPRYKACELTRSGGASAVGELYAQPGAPSALVCFNDIVALGAMAGLDRIGKRVGTDVSVVGFDNVPEAAFVRPALTTIDSNARQLGAEAAKLMLTSVKDGVRAAVDAPMPTRFVLRETTGPAHQTSTEARSSLLTPVSFSSSAK
ncbi:substrate-binding domain-containing protein [Devosia sp. D6-9]|nr:substrate-binding domain-containing protein [Devosia sp. D6-9]